MKFYGYRCPEYSDSPLSWGDSMSKVPFTQHLNLRGFDAAGLTYRVCQTEYPIHPHTDETRRALREKSIFYRHIGDDRLTHFVDASLNEDSVALSMVTQLSTLEVGGVSYPIDLMTWGSIGIPVQSVRLALADAPTSRTEAAEKTISNRLRHIPGIAVSVPEGLSLEEHVQVCVDAISYGDALSTAAYFAYQHNAVLHLNATQPYPWYIYDTYVLPANGLEDVVPVLESTAVPWYTTWIGYDDRAGHAAGLSSAHDRKQSGCLYLRRRPGWRRDDAIGHLLRVEWMDRGTGRRCRHRYMGSQQHEPVHGRRLHYDHDQSCAAELQHGIHAEGDAGVRRNGGARMRGRPRRHRPRRRLLR
jgi:hypothetical protein